MKVFWNMSGTIPRLLSQERRDQLELLTTAAHNPEAAAELFKALNERAPEAIQLTGKAQMEMSSIRDEEGFEALRNMAG